MKERDDLNDVIREESSRGKKRPLDTDAINELAERRDAVLRIFRRGTREDLRALLKAWGYSKEEIEAALMVGAREVAATTLRIPHPYTESDARSFIAGTQGVR